MFAVVLSVLGLGVGLVALLRFLLAALRLTYALLRLLLAILPLVFALPRLLFALPGLFRRRHEFAPWLRRWFRQISIYLVLTVLHLFLLPDRHTFVDRYIDYVLSCDEFFAGEDVDFSWSGSNILDKVRDQGDNGTCFLFAVLSAISSALALANGLLILLAPQFILDRWGIRTNYCAGGMAANVYKFARDSGVPEEEFYPYSRETDPRRPSEFQVRRVTVQSYGGVDSFESAKARLLKHPITATVKVPEQSFRKFRGRDVYNPPSNWRELEHGLHSVLIVGCGHDSRIGADLKDDDVRKGKYFIIKNSYGIGWGFWGYAKLPVHMFSNYRYPIGAKLRGGLF